jgi:hypothetical protein
MSKRFSPNCLLILKNAHSRENNGHDGLKQLSGEEILGGGESAKQPLLRPPALKSGYLGKI